MGILRTHDSKKAQHLKSFRTCVAQVLSTICGNCGAYIYHGLLRCPNCGVYLDEPGDKEEERPKFRPKSKFSLAIESVMRKIRGEPHPAEELFTGALREAALFDDLLRKVGGDRSVVERLLEYERQGRPGATRLACLQNAISRWKNENG
jgi:uncharacterized Zn finger protein (UPF0148 family)